MLWCLKPHKAVRAGWDQASSARGSSLGLGRYPGIPPGGALLTGIRFDGHGPLPPPHPVLRMLASQLPRRPCRCGPRSQQHPRPRPLCPVRPLGFCSKSTGSAPLWGQTEVTTQTGLSSWVTRRGQRALKQEHPRLPRSTNSIANPVSRARLLSSDSPLCPEEAPSLPSKKIGSHWTPPRLFSLQPLPLYLSQGLLSCWSGL